jgi:FtsZ-interacting cell division protein ZipA
MTDLQLSLVAAGIAFIVVIVIYNVWREYRARKSVDQAFSGDQDDILMNPRNQNEVKSQRQEPQFGSDDAHPFAHSETRHNAPDFEEHDSVSVLENEHSVIDASVDTNDNLTHLEEKELSVDELIDCVIALEFEAPMRGEKLLTEISDLRYIGKKPVHFIGLNHAGERDEIAHGGAYTTLFAGIQMVSRSGPLNELEYSEFVGKLRIIADRLNAHSDIPDMNHVMENARNLHQFMAEHDAQLSVNILSNGAPWDLTTLLAALEKQGFDVRPDGRLVMPDGDVGNLFTLSTNVSASETVTSRLTLLLDVPCVSTALDGFGAMSACARSLAARLGGKVVDDSNNEISKEALTEIADQVRDFCAGMAEAQIPAGSRRAKRLFS